MKKTDLSGRLSQKGTTIAVAAVILFVIIGIIVAVAWHSTYINMREAKIVNVSASPKNDAIYATGTPGYLAYNYSADKSSIDLTKIVSVSDGARLAVKKVILLDLTEQKTNTVLSVADGQEYIVYLEVVSDGNIRRQNYVLEIRQENHLAGNPEGNDIIVPDLKGIPA